MEHHASGVFYLTYIYTDYILPIVRLSNCDEQISYFSTLYLKLRKREVRNMLFDQIAEIVAEHLDCDKEEIKAESTFESLGIDSLDAVELVMKLEESLDVQLDLDRDLATIDELVKFVEEKMN